MPLSQDTRGNAGGQAEPVCECRNIQTVDRRQIILFDGVHRISDPERGNAEFA
jgi:hypothetical protein